MNHFFKTIATIGVLAVLSCNGQNEEAAILKVLSSQEQAWNSGDIDKFMEGYYPGDSLMFVGGKNITYGWQQTLGRYKKSYPDKAAMGKLHFEIIQVKVLSPNDALVIGSWQLTDTKNNPGGHFSLLFRKYNGVWKITIDHTS
ncbi:MAG: DUF4440 domain-containing protein [Edaphocola sp.]